MRNVKYSKYLTKEALKGYGGFRVDGQVTGTMKCAGDLVLVAKEEMVLQGMIDRLTKLEHAME